MVTVCVSAQSVALKLSNIIIAWRLWEMQTHNNKCRNDPFFASLNQDLNFNKILRCFEHFSKFELAEVQLLNLNFLFQMFIVHFWLFLNCPFPSFACFKMELSLCILDTSSLLYTWYTQFFSYSECWIIFSLSGWYSLKHRHF